MSVKCNYWKCKVIKRKRGETHGAWTVYIIESGYCVSHHRSFQKAISKAIKFQHEMRRCA